MWEFLNLFFIKAKYDTATNETKNILQKHDAHGKLDQYLPATVTL